MNITKAVEKTHMAPAVDEPLESPESSAWRSFCNGLAQYAAATAAAVLVLSVFFPGNRFLPVPWQHDDYNFLSPPAPLQNGWGLVLFCTRPISTNIAWRLGMLGETPYYAGMFLLATLIPVLAVQVALRLFQCRPKSWIVAGLAAGVSACTFLFEHSLWCYRFSTILPLISVVFGLLSAQCFSRWLDGRRAGFIAGSLLYFGSAFSKEDMLLFVPLLTGVEWSIRRLQGAGRAPLARLASAYGAVAAVLGLLFIWNTWIVPSPFTSNTIEPYKLSFSLMHLARQVWHYAAASPLTLVAFAALVAASVLGACRSQRRLAALAMVPLIVAMILPFAVLPRFFEYYCLNWLSLVVSLAAVCVAVNCRDWLPSRLASAAWLAPLAVLVAIFAFTPSAASFRFYLTAWINRQQTDNQYILEQLQRHQDDLAGADTVAVCGADQCFSPWLLTTGAYVNAKIGHDVHWLLVVRPGSLVEGFQSPSAPPLGDVTVVPEKNLANYPSAVVLSFDKNLNMSVKTATLPAVTARAATVMK